MHCPGDVKFLQNQCNAGIKYKFFRCDEFAVDVILVIEGTQRPKVCNLK